MKILTVDQIIELNRETRIGENGQLGVLGVAESVMGPSQLNNNDWKLTLQLVSFSTGTTYSLHSLKLEIWVKNTCNGNDPSSVIPKAATHEMPVVRCGDIVLATNVISKLSVNSSTDSSEIILQIGANITRTVLVLPYEKFLAQSPQNPLTHFSHDRCLSAGASPTRSMFSKLNMSFKKIQNETELYQRKIISLKRAYKEDSFHGLVLKVVICPDPNTKQISNCILDILVDDPDNRECVATSQRKPISVQVGQDYTKYLPTNYPKVRKLILERDSTRAALCQRLQVGSGIFISNVAQIDQLNFRPEFSHELSPDNPNCSILVMNPVQVRVLKLMKNFSRAMSEQLSLTPA